MTGINNLAEFFNGVMDYYTFKNAINWKEKDKYTGLNGEKIKELVYHAAKAFEEFGLKKGDKAAIISETRFEWVITDFACILNGIITVPIYTTMTAEQVKFILKHSESKLCFASTKLLAEKVSGVFNDLSELKYIISFNKTESVPEHLINFEDIIYKEVVHDKNAYNKADADRYFMECSEKLDPEDTLTIIYTSGTTGNPKGVCLSHKNVLSNVKQCTDSFVITDKDKFLSFLPLAHTYERTAGYYLPLSKGAEIYYAQSIETLNTQMQEVKPTVILTVPILFSRIQSRLLKSIEALPKMEKFVSKKALSIAKKHGKNKNNFLWKLADKKVFSKIRERTGGNIRFFISGGSALNKELAEFFDGIGILILQGYGMTEASPVITVNRPETNCFGTVGQALVGVEIKIAEDGEILARGDNIMQGYYNNEKDTSETLINGWLHTGDIGVIDKNGILKITDRKKTLIKTSGGKYISLTHIEDTIGESKYVEQIITFASDERQYVTALIVPNYDELGEMAKAHGIEFHNNISLVDNEKIYDLMEKEVNNTQKHLAKYERVRKFILMPASFTIDGGDMTPTLKLKRKVIEEKYKDVIDGLYKKK